MSITIRLAKVGRKKAPAYKIVVAQTRDKRNGKFLDILGHYNPSMKPISYSLDEEKYTEWKSKGAIVSKAVEQLKEGTYEFKPYNPNAKEEEAKAAAEAAAEAKKQAEQVEIEADTETKVEPSTSEETTE